MSGITLVAGIGLGATEAAVGSAAAIGATAAAGTAAATASASILAGGLSAVGAAGYAAFASSLTLTSFLNGASLAWSIGSTLASMFGGNNGGAGGPRLTNLHVQSAAYGQPIKRFWGVDRMAGELVWIGSDGKGGRGIREHRQTVEGGKGKGGPAAFFYTYEGDFAISINGASNCAGVLRIWAGSKLIYDHRKDTDLKSRIGTGINLEGGQKGKVTFYDGNENQKPPALIEALAGVGNTSAYRNQFLAVFNKFDVTNYGGQIPSFSFECYTDGSEVFQQIYHYDVNNAVPARNPFPAKQVSWSFVSPVGEIYALAGVQAHFWSETINGEHPLEFIRLLSDGSIVSEERPPLSTIVPHANPGGNLAPGISDEPMAMSAGDAGLWCFRPGKVAEFIAAGFPEFFAKKEQALYLYKNGSWGRLFEKRQFPGGFLLAQADYATFYADPTNVPDQICMGDDFLWGLRARRINAFGSVITHAKLFKIDPDTLEVLETIDLGSSCMAKALYVLSDDDIKLIGEASDDFLSGIALFYEYVDGELNSLGGSLTAPIGNAHIGTLFVRNGVWYTGIFGEWGYYDTTIRAWVPGEEANCCPLWKIVRDICIADGLDEEDIDVTELQDCVRGYTLDQQMTGRDAILPLQRYAFFDARESNLKLEFIKRGHDPVATLQEAELAARPSLDTALPDTISQTRADETELPATVNVRFKDQDADYQTGMTGLSRLTTESSNVLTVDVAVVMDSDKATQIRDVLMFTHWLERAPKDIAITRRHVRLDAADPINLEVVAP